MEQKGASAPWRSVRVSEGQEPRRHPGSAKQVPAFSLEGDVAPATEGEIPLAARFCVPAPRAAGVLGGRAPCKKAAKPLSPPISNRTKKESRRTLFSWRWADSNRRPNKAPTSFLHAYPPFDCRRRTAGRPAMRSLSSESWRALETSTRAGIA